MKNYRDILIKAGLALAAIIVIFTAISRLLFTGSDTLADYAQKNPELAYKESSTVPESSTVTPENTGNQTPIVSEPASSQEAAPSITTAPEDEPTTEPTPDPQTVILQQFYYAPLTEEQKDYLDSWQL